MTATYETDWTRRWTGRAAAVVRPASTDEVASVLQECASFGQPVVPQGGNTGLVGGSVPRQGELVLSLRRLDDIGAVDPVSGQVTAGAGAVLADVQRRVEVERFDVGIDLAARDSATIGGMVATNAGGIHVLRHGSMRRRVVGIEAVTPGGQVVRRLSGLTKDNSGYDLAGLLCGSEGTLAVVTHVRLQLVPRPDHTVVTLVAVDSTDAALRVLAAVRRLPSLQAAELFHARGLDLVVEHAGAARPFATAYPSYLLLECAADDDPTDQLAGALAGCDEVLDTAVAGDAGAAASLWQYRERHTEAINAAGIPHKLDVTLPLDRLARFEREVEDVVDRACPGALVVLFGHLGDGNVHVNIVGPPPEDETVDGAVLELVAAYGGSISAEHGIGVAKVGWLPLTRGAPDLGVMRAIKHALDPNGLLNPGVLFPPAG